MDYVKRKPYPMTISFRFEWLKALLNSDMDSKEKLALLKKERQYIQEVKA